MLRLDRVNRVIYALSLAIESQFDRSDWTKVAYQIDEVDIISKHPRLLRSLSWGDPDYTENVINVLTRISRKPENLKAIAEYVRLDDWLRSNNIALYRELYGDEDRDVLDENPLDIITFDLSKHIQRIYHSLDQDPELALGSTKEMLETILITMLEDKIADIDKLDIQDLVREVKRHYELVPPDIEDNKVNEITRRVVSNLGQIIVGIGELRNICGTGHGRIKKAWELKDYHTRVAVNSGVTLAKFLTELYEDQE